MFKIISLFIFINLFFSCATYQKFSDPMYGLDQATAAKINAESKRKAEVSKTYICSPHGSYESGYNDGQSGQPMNAKSALEVCGNELSKYVESYKKGYLEAPKIKTDKNQILNNPLSILNANSGGQILSKKTCIEAYGKKACGYDCKEAYGQLACANNPEDNCVVAYGKIRCGFQCQEKFGQIKCGDEN